MRGMLKALQIRAYPFCLCRPVVLEDPFYSI